MRNDIEAAFSKSNVTRKKYNISLSVEYEFKRKNPPDKKISKGDTTKSLDINYLEDCLTSKQIAKWITIDCKDEKPKNAPPKSKNSA
jgi:hypothetical protein